MYHQITWHPFIASLFSTQVEDTDVHSNVDVTPDHSAEERASETEVEEDDLGSEDIEVREIQLDELVV